MRRRLSLSALVSALTFVSSLFFLAPPASANFEVPTGKVAYVTTASGHRTIVAIDIANPNDIRTIIDLGDRDATEPTWSVDGTLIAFTAQTTPGGATAIFVANGDGTGIEQVTSPGSGESDSDPSWSPTGNQIVFGRILITGLSKILIVDVATTGLRALDFSSLPSASEPDWSPNGQQIAFVARASVDPSLCGTEPRACSWNLFVANADGSGEPRPLSGQGFDFHDPDWSPNGARIAAGLSLAGDPAPIVGMVIDVISGGTSATIFSGIYEPSWSPSGHLLIVRSGATETVLLIYDEFGSFVRFGVSPGSEPAWGVSSPQPPPPDTTPPTIEFSMVTNDQGWLKEPALLVIGRDASGVDHFTCTLDGQTWRVNSGLPAIELRGGIELYGVAEGSHLLSCTAFDISGNHASKDQTVKVDTTPPTLGSVSVDLNPKRVDQTATVTVPFSENGSGILEAEIRLSFDNTPIPMTVSGSTLIGVISASVPTGTTNVTVSVFDNNFNQSVATMHDFLIVYDPSAGSISGDGWIVPGGLTSDRFDSLPGGTDGTSRASLDFKVAYKGLKPTTPAGTLSFGYGEFKLVSQDFEWLLIRPMWAEVSGTATIKGLTGSFAFRAFVQDGSSNGSPDRFELRIWPLGADPFHELPLYQATGNVGGRILIKH